MHTFIIATLSADGFISPIQGAAEHTRKWSSKEDILWFKQKTLEAGIVIMGRKSYDTIPAKYKPLKDRLNIVYTSKPLPNSHQLADYLSSKNQDPGALLTTTLPPNELINLLNNQLFNNDSIKTRNIAICGGSSIYTQFINSGLVNKLFLTYEPVLFGQGITLFDKPIHQKLNLVQIHSLSDQTKVFEYLVNN